MTNLQSEDFDEIDYAYKIGQEPGFMIAHVVSPNHEYKQYADSENNLHRLMGPAHENIKGSTDVWFFHGKEIECNSQKEFDEFLQRILKLKVFW